VREDVGFSCEAVSDCVLAGFCFAPSVVGPVECSALVRLAASFSSDMDIEIRVPRLCCSRRDWGCGVKLLSLLMKIAVTQKLAPGC